MEEKHRFVIAIDGPAGSGKSTVAAAVAEHLDAILFDTGAVYRALTVLALERGISPSDGPALARLAAEMPLRVDRPTVDDGRQYDVWAGQRDITWEIRDAAVDRAVSEVSAHPEVRRALVDVQRSIGRSGRVVMPGRDIGTVIAPDADLKIWLDASIDERARRRHRQLAQQGVERDYGDVKRELAARDQFDGSRETAPMVAASDAVLIDSEDCSIDEVVAAVLALARKRGIRHRHLSVEE